MSVDGIGIPAAGAACYKVYSEIHDFIKRKAVPGIERIIKQEDEQGNQRQIDGKVADARPFSERDDGVCEYQQDKACLKKPEKWYDEAVRVHQRLPCRFCCQFDVVVGNARQQRAREKCDESQNDERKQKSFDFPDGKARDSGRRSFCVNHQESRNEHEQRHPKTGHHPVEKRARSEATVGILMERMSQHNKNYADNL